MHLYRVCINFLRPFKSATTNFTLVGPGHGKLNPIMPVANKSSSRVPSVPANRVGKE